jgi:hypothetical protein
MSKVAYAERTEKKLVLYGRRNVLSNNLGRIHTKSWTDKVVTSSPF